MTNKTTTFNITGERHKILHFNPDILDAKLETQCLRRSTLAPALWKGKQKALSSRILLSSELCGWPLHTRLIILERIRYMEGNIGTRLGVEANQLLQCGRFNNVEAHFTTKCA